MNVIIIVDLANDWTALGIDGQILYNETDNSYLTGSTAGTTLLTVDNYYGCTTKEVAVETFRTGTFEELQFGGVGTEGTGEGFGLSLDWSLEDESGELFDYQEDTLVINYPSLTLTDVLTTDAFADGPEYDVAIKLYDQTYDRIIWLHYCWGNDSTLIGGHEDREVVIRPDNTTHIYLWQEDQQLSAVPQTVHLDLFNGLNELVKESVTVIDRENTTHTLDIRITIENGSYFQCSSLLVNGFKPSSVVNLADGGETTVDLGTLFPPTLSQSETVTLANAFFFSTKQQSVRFRVTGDSPWKLLVNSMIVNASDSTDPSTPIDSEIPLRGGLNFLSLVIEDTSPVTSFEVRLLQSGEDVPAENLKVVTGPKLLQEYPVVSAPVGTGKITCFTLSSEYTGYQASMKDLLTNILTNELEHKKIPFAAKKHTFLSAVDDAFYSKYADFYYDWYNEDQPYSTTPKAEVLQTIEEQLGVTNKKLYKVLATARCKEGQNLDSVLALDSALESLFVAAHMTGDATSWYDYETVSYTLGGQPEDWEAEKDTSFDIDREYCFHTYEQWLWQPYKQNNHWFSIIKGYTITDEGLPHVQLKLRTMYYERGFLEQYGIWEEVPDTWTDDWGIVDVYNDSHVFVQQAVQGPDDTVYLEADQWVSLVDFLNVTGHLISSMNNYVHSLDADLDNPNILDFLSSGLGKGVGYAASTLAGLWFVDLSKHMKNYVLNLRQQLFHMSYQSAYEFLSAQEDAYAKAHGYYDEPTTSGYLSEGEIYDQAMDYADSYYYRNHSRTLNEQTAQPSEMTPEDIGVTDPPTYQDYWHWKGKYELTDDEGNTRTFDAPNIRKSPAWNFIEQFVAFSKGHSGAKGTLTESMISFLNDAVAVYLSSDFMAKDEWASRAYLAQQTDYVLIPTEGATKDENNDHVPPKMCGMLLGPQIEDIGMYQGMSAIQIGLTVENFLRLIITKEDGITPIFQRRFLFKPDVLETTLQRLFDPNYEGTGNPHSLYGSLQALEGYPKPDGITDDLGTLKKLSSANIKIAGQTRSVNYYQLNTYTSNGLIGDEYGNPFSILFGCYEDDQGKLQFFPAYFFEGESKDYAKELIGKIDYESKFAIENLAKHITTATEEDTIEQTIIQSLNNLPSEHPFYKQSYDELLEKGWQPYIMPGTDGSSEKVIIWLKGGTLYCLHPPEEVQDKSIDEIDIRARIIAPESKMDPQKADVESQHAISDDGHKTITAIAAKNGYDIAICDTPSMTQWKRMWKQTLKNYYKSKQIYESTANYNYRNPNDPKELPRISDNARALMDGFLTFVILPKVVQDISGALEAHKAGDSFGGIDLSMTDYLTSETVRGSFRRWENFLIGLINSWNWFSDEHEKGTLVLTKDGIIDRLAKNNFIKVFNAIDQIWEVFDLDQFYGQDKEWMAHGIHSEITQAVFETRLEMREGGEVPSLSGLLTTLMTLQQNKYTFDITETDENGKETTRTVTINEVPGLDPYVLTYHCWHELGGYHGMNFIRDIQLDEDEEKYLPYIGIIKLFSHMYKSLNVYDGETEEALEDIKNRLFYSDQDPNKYYLPDKYYDVPAGLNLPIFNPDYLRPTLFDTIMTRIVDTNNNEYLTLRPIDRATNSGVKSFLDQICHALFLTENVDRNDYSVINELVEKMNLYKILETIKEGNLPIFSASSDPKIDLVDLNNNELHDWQDVYNSDLFNGIPYDNNLLTIVGTKFTRQKTIYKNGKWEVVYDCLMEDLPKLALGALSYTEFEQQLRAAGYSETFARMYFKSYLGQTLLAQKIDQESGYTIGDLAIDSTVFVSGPDDNKNYHFYKAVHYQVCDQNGNPIMNEDTPQWGFKLIEITADNKNAFKIRKLDDPDTLEKEFQANLDSQGKPVIPKAGLVSTTDGRVISNFVFLKDEILEGRYKHRGQKEVKKPYYRELIQGSDPEQKKDKIEPMTEQFKRKVNEISDQGLEVASLSSEGTAKTLTLCKKVGELLQKRLTGTDAKSQNYNKLSQQTRLLHRNPWIRPIHENPAILSLMRYTKVDRTIKKIETKQKVIFDNHPWLAVTGRLLGKVLNELKDVIRYVQNYIRILSFIGGITGTIALALIAKNASPLKEGVNQILSAFLSRNYQFLSTFTGQTSKSVALGSFTAMKEMIKKIAKSSTQISLMGSYQSIAGTVTAMPQQFMSQAWMHPLIEGAVISGYIATATENLQGIIGNGTSVGSRGSLVEQYATDYEPGDPGYYPGINEDHNKTCHWHALRKALWTWVTDYIEFGEYWEIINGLSTGEQLALVDCGMTPVNNGTGAVFVEDYISLVRTIKGLIQLEGRTIPPFLRNETQFVQSPSFQWFWQNVVLSVVGGMISAASEVFEQGFSMAFTGGIAGVYSSMLLGYLVQEAYSGLYRSVAQNSWKNNYVNRLSSQQFRRGDPGYDDRPFRFRLMEYIAGTPEKYKAFVAMAYIGVSLILCWGVVSAAGSTTALVSLGFWATLSIVTAVVLVVAGGVYLALKKYGVIKEKGIVIDQTYGDPPES